MSLLHCVLNWDNQHIQCQALAPLTTDHPLRDEGQLVSLIGIEYVAQAIAVHGALRHPRHAPSPGMLTAVHHVQWYAAQLDCHQQPLEIEATQVAEVVQACRYQFRVRSGGNLLLSGEASLFFTPMPEPTS